MPVLQQRKEDKQRQRSKHFQERAHTHSGGNSPRQQVDGGGVSPSWNEGADSKTSFLVQDSVSDAKALFPT